MKRKRVLVSAYYAQNVGDDLFLKVLFTRYNDVDWYLLTANKHYKKVFKSYPHVNIVKTYREIKTINMFITLQTLTKRIKRFDAFVMIGGSIFIENEDWQRLYSVRNQLIQLLDTYGIPSYIIGANFGPFATDLFKQKYLNYFNYCTNISFRDLYSYRLFSQLSNVQVAPDAVLTLDVEHFSNKRTKNIVGISLISLKRRKNLRAYEQVYYMTFKEIITYYIKHNYFVKLFSFCEKEGDLNSIYHLLKLLPYDYLKKIKIVNYDGKINLFLHEFQRCTKIIGTRFHSLILALKFNQPFLPIIYSKKMINGLQQIGIKKYGYLIEELSTFHLNDLKEAFIHFKSNEQFKKAEKHFAHLDELLN